MRKIRVCHISEATAGGVYKHLLQLAEHLDRDQFEQTFVLSPLKNQHLLKEESLKGHKLYLINMQREIKLHADIISLYRILKVLKKNKFDIIHCHSSKAGVLGRVAAWLCGCSNIIYTPHCFSFHDGNSYYKNILYASIEKATSKITTKIICVSNGERDEALKWKVASNEKVIVIPNGIEMKNEKTSKAEKKQKQQEYLIQNGYTGNEFVIGFVGRLSEQKNPEMLIHSLAKMKVENVLCMIIGEGKLRNRLDDLVIEKGLENKVLFVGEVDSSYYFEIFDLFVSTSLWEGLPYTILESMAVKVPVIATNISGVRELINEGYNGYLVTPSHVETLASKIEAFIAQPDEEITNRAEKLVRTEYQVSRMIEQISAVYQQRFEI